MDGLCLNDCKNKGCVHDGLDCVDLGTVTSCEQICQTDADCGDNKCAGVGADGTSFCVYPGPCTSDADCDEGPEFPDRACNLETGTCGCTSDDHCAEYWGCAN